MITFSLQSGSNGNAIYVESQGVRLLFDAGISGKQAQLRMACHQRDIRGVHAVIISHDHRDHVACAGIYQRKFGIPVYASPATYSAVRHFLGPMDDVRHFRSGDTLSFNGLRVHTVPTPHDAVDGVAFVVESEGRRLAILTDLGHPTDRLRGILESVDAAYLESNYDPDMLEAGQYPPLLKMRIRGQGGHLSNEEAAALIKACGRRRPAWIAVAHLSEENNRPDLALAAQRKATGADYPIHLASRYQVSPLLVV